MSGTTVEAYMERVVYGEVSSSFAVAAARMIAAAPEMYAELERVAAEIRCGIADWSTVCRIDTLLTAARDGSKRNNAKTT
jgi:hypothetical protein